MIPKNATGGDSLRALGLRLTAPRRLILDVVRATDAHPSAAFVYARVRRRLPRVSLATVYRNLRLLAAQGLLQERAEPTGLRFDGNATPHDHFTCVVCGRIFDVPPAGQTRSGGDRRREPGALAGPGRLAARLGFEVLEQRVELSGRCDSCRRSASSSRASRTSTVNLHPQPQSRQRRDHAEKP